MVSELEIAKETAKKAGALVLEYYHNQNFNVIEKGNYFEDYLTEADKASEDLIFKELKTYFPEYGFRGEETSNKKDDKDVVWIIDPIDGTREFIKRNGQFAIHIGLAKNEEAVLGVVFLPAIDKLFYAEKGKGAYLNGKRISVSKRNNLSEMRFTMSNRLLREEKYYNIFNNLECEVKKTLQSAGNKICAVANGNFDICIYKERTAHEWDFCAPAIILEEAGGKITTMDGKPLRYNKEESDYPQPILASNNKIHEKLLEILK